MDSIWIPIYWIQSIIINLSIILDSPIYLYISHILRLTIILPIIPIYPINLPRISQGIPAPNAGALADQRRRGHLCGAAEAAEHRGLERHVHVVPGTTNSGVGSISVASYESSIYIMYVYIYI